MSPSSKGRSLQCYSEPRAASSSAIEPALRHSLTRPPGLLSIYLLDEVSILKLQFNTPARRFLTNIDRRAILSAFADLAQHSQRLNAFPKLKTALWIDVLRTRFVYKNASAYTSLFKIAAFPACVINFSLRYGNEGCIVNESVGEALWAFMTTPAPLETQLRDDYGAADSRTEPHVVFGLSFADCKLTVASLKIIERVLDHAFAHPTRQYAIKSLSFNGNLMRNAELAFVARIVEKTSKREYQIEELHLDSIVPTNSHFLYRPPEVTPNAFLAIVESALAVDSLRNLATRGPQSILVTLDQSPSHLRKVLLSRNAVCPRFFAAMFSALQYGCPLAEDASKYLIQNSRLTHRMSSMDSGPHSSWVCALTCVWPRHPRTSSMLTPVSSAGAGSRLRCSTHDRSDSLVPLIFAPLGNWS